MKVTDYIADFLEKARVQTVFELSGGMITHLLDSLCRRQRIRIVSMHHEQAAAFAAEANGRITGIPGVALATSGPGATNLLTGIGSCYFDSSPAVFITGQVNRNEQKAGRSIRQLGFQETDIVAMAQPITKAAWIVRDVTELPELLERAFVLAANGRPGPVLLDIPMDVQRSEFEATALPALPTISHLPAITEDTWRTIRDRLDQSQHPLIVAGGGLRSGRAAVEFRTFVEQLGVPVVHSLMGVDVLPFDHPLRVGMLGTYGNRWANLAVGLSDLLLVLGSRLDVRQTGSRVDAFKRGREIIHVDCESAEINNRVTGCLPIISELKPFLKAAITQIPSVAHRMARWRDEISANRNRWPDVNELKHIQGIHPNRFMHLLSRMSARAGAFVVDVGQHQMWAAQSLELRSDQRFLTSGGMGSMGFALPAAIGACFAEGRPALVIAGDGGFQCNIHELQTVVRNQLPIKIVIINNNCHGMVRQFQESYFDRRYQSTLWGYSAPDFVKVAQAYGLDGLRIAEEREGSEAIAWLWRDPKAPALLEVAVDPEANAYPKVLFGGEITEMEPRAQAKNESIE